MKTLTIIFLFFICADCFAQDNPLTNKKFLLIISPHNGQGEWLYFVDDTLCIRSTGSAAWGTTSDTLKYKFKKDIVLFKQFKANINKTSLTTKKLKIEQVSADIFKRDNFTYTRRRIFFFQTDNDSLKSIIVLRRMK